MTLSEEPSHADAPSRRSSSADGLLNLALLLALGMLPGALHQLSPAVPATYIALGAILFFSRSLPLSFVATFAAALLLRLQPSDLWPDQLFVQHSALSSLLSGHGIYYAFNGIGTSWSVYLPMADLLMALPVWFLGADFWMFFQVLVLAVISLPYCVAPSQTTFRLFLVFALFTPLAQLTSRANALELGCVVLFAGFWLLLRERQLPLAAALLGYGALLRQPALVIVPFVALALWRLRARRALATFAAALVFGGLVHVLRNPFGFFDATVRIWEKFADQWFHKLGAKGNYSISTMLYWLGDERALEHSRQRIYLALLGAALVGVLLFIWRDRSRPATRFVAAAVAGAIGSTLLVHVLNRGFVQFHYLVAGALPALAFVDFDRVESWASRDGMRVRRFSLQSVLVAAVGATIALLVFTPHVLAAAGEFRQRRPVEGRSLDLRRVEAGVQRLEWLQDTNIPPMNSAHLPISEPLRIELNEPSRVSELVLEGARIPPQWIDGVVLVYPTRIQAIGFLRSGVVEGSADGASWRTLARFRNVVHPSFYPTRIALDASGEPVRHLRLVGGVTWADEAEWALGGVELYGETAATGR